MYRRIAFHFYTCKFSKSASRITKFARGPSVFHTTMRNKKVDFNPYLVLRHNGTGFMKHRLTLPYEII